MEKIIPLFPLPLVIFPGSKYPIHIFEERYKKMIGKCINQNLCFGIITSSNKGFNKVGCYVKIIESAKKDAKGEFNIIVVGLERFQLIKTQMNPDGYLEAEVEKYSDFVSESYFLLEEQLKLKFQELMEKIDFKLDEKFWMNLDSAELKSFKLAEKTGLSLEEQQKLISLQTEKARLRFLINHLDKVEKYFSGKPSISRITMNDGYLN
jgi:ATP-dependent Lon protease